MDYAKRKSLFISYAHKDGLEYTRRLAFDLGLHMDVFWDRRLQAGNFPLQLNAEIDARDCFLLVMTPSAINSDWCRKELCRAIRKRKKIALARMNSGEGTVDEKLAKRYTYADFTDDYDQGFRRLTMMLLDEPVSSWEYLASEPDLLKHLENGKIPGLIAKEIAEWVIVSEVWRFIDEYAAKMTHTVYRAKPYTANGLFRHIRTLLEQFANLPDQPGLMLLTNIVNHLEGRADKIVLIRDDDHHHACLLAYEIIQAVKGTMMHESAALSVFDSLIYFQKGYFEFAVTEKLRDFINIHARRSRYLY